MAHGMDDGVSRLGRRTLFVVGGGAGSSMAPGMDDGVSRLGRRTLFVVGGGAGSSMASGLDDGVSMFGRSISFERCCGGWLGSVTNGICHR